MARATKAKTPGKARTRRTSPEVERSGSDAPRGHYVAEYGPVPQEPQSETAKRSIAADMSPPKPTLEEEILEYLRYEDGDPTMFKVYEVLSQFLKIELPDSFAKTTALRKLVESKDAAKRIQKLYNKRKNDMAWVVKYNPENPMASTVTRVQAEKPPVFAVAKK